MQSAEKNLKILYLDYDGVLHHEHVYFHPRQGIYIAAPGRSLFEWLPILEELLAPYPEVKIVLSTTWVRVRSFDFAKSRLSKALQERVVGATFHRRFMPKESFAALPRGEQIARDVFRRGPSAWFAVDDDGLHWPSWCRNNLIKTNGSTGLSDPVIQIAVRTMLQRF